MKKIISALTAVVATTMTLGLSASTSPAKENSQYPVLYGSMTYANTFAGGEVGLYEIPTSDNQDFTPIFLGPSADGGGVCRNGIYYSTTYSSATGSIVSTITGWELQTGRLVRKIETDHSVIGHLALDPLTNEIYGITFRPELGGYMLAHITIDKTDVKVEKIANLEGFWAAFAISPTGQFYGISKTRPETISDIVANLYSIDRETGKTRLIGKTGETPYDNTDATIDARTGKMYWCVSDPDNGSKLVEVNLNTAETTLVRNFYQSEQMTGIFVPAAVAAVGSPAECTDIKFSFEGGSQDGKLTLTTPTYLYDSDVKGDGTLYISVITEGESIAFTNVPWGQTVSIDIDMNDFEPGLYNFTVVPVNAAGDGPKTFVNDVFVGIDSPAAPKPVLSYDGGKANLSWEAVKVGQYGGWIDLSNITYNVYSATGEKLASNLKTTTWSANVAEPTTLTDLYYYVEAVSGARISDQGKSNTVVLGYEKLPYTSQYSLNQDLRYFTVIDGNGDGRTWHTAGTYVQCVYNQYEKMDDWLITPPFKMEAKTPYILRFSAFASQTNSRERIEVYAGRGTTVEAMEYKLIEPTEFNNGADAPYQFEVYFVPQESGNYNIGFHGISDAFMSALNLNDFTVEMSADADNPDLPGNLTVEPDLSGDLKAVISFTAPEKSICGETLTALSKIEVKRSGTVVKTFNNPRPGEQLTYTDTPSKRGEYTYSVTAYNEHGEGRTASASTVIGLDVPAVPAGLVMKRTDKEGEIEISWTPVTTDCNGKPFKTPVTYMVNAFCDGKIKVVGTNMTDTKVTYQAVAAGRQEFVQCEVIAVAETGNSELAISEVLPVGAAYEDFTESFMEGVPLYNWRQEKDNDDADARFESYNDSEIQTSADDDNGFLAFYSSQAGERVRLQSGLISLQDMTAPGLSFYLLNNAKENTRNNDRLRIYARGGNDTEWDKIFDKSIADAIHDKDGWTQIKLNLAKFAGQDLQIALEGEVSNYFYFFMDKIQVLNLPDVDLSAVAISAPVYAQTGQDYTVEVEVENSGAKDVAEYTVVLYADGVVSERKKCSDLKAGFAEKVTFTIPMPADAVTAIVYNATVECTGDAIKSNNTTESTKVLPMYSNLPAAKDLRLKVVDDCVTLDWNEAKPAAAPGEAVTHDFEDAVAFSSAYDSWKFVDLDDSPVSGMKDYTIPGIVYGESKASFMVWDMQEVPSTQFDAFSGTKFLFSLFRKDGGMVDDWAISPELIGTKQTITFFARSVAAAFAERIEVYYSEGSTDPADFQRITTVGGNVPGRWTEYTFEVPDGAKYFAIRSCAKDALMLMIDNVTFIPSDPLTGNSLIGYDIYRDGGKLNASPVAVTTYKDTTADPKGSYTYRVVAVYTNAVSAPSNTVSLNPSAVEEATAGLLTVTANNGVIRVSGAAGEYVRIISVDGRNVYASAGTESHSVRVGSGVYLVCVGDKTVKVIL